MNYRRFADPSYAWTYKAVQYIIYKYKFKNTTQGGVIFGESLKGGF